MMFKSSAILADDGCSDCIEFNGWASLCRFFVWRFSGGMELPTSGPRAAPSIALYRSNTHSTVIVWEANLRAVLAVE